MTKRLTVIIVLVLITRFSIIAQTSPAPAPSVPASFDAISGTIRNSRFIINWVVNNNQTADQFEIEKSTDGKNFSLAGIVFGTDIATYNNYQFFEKASGVKTIYRIKLVSKNKTAYYSSLIEINPAS